MGTLSKPSRKVCAPGIPGAPDQPVVERGEQRLARGGERDDRLHRGVVLGPRVQQLLHARQEFRRRQVFGGSLPSQASTIARSAGGSLAPARSAAARAGWSAAEWRGGTSQELPGRGGTIVVGVAVDRGEPEVALPRKLVAEELVHERSRRTAVTDPSTRSANSGVSGSGSCSTMLARA